MLHVLQKADKQTMFNYMIKSDQDLEKLEGSDEHEDKVTRSNRQDGSDSNKEVMADSGVVEEGSDEKSIKNTPGEGVPVTKKLAESDNTDTLKTTDNSTQAENKEQTRQGLVTESGPKTSESKEHEQNGEGSGDIVKETMVFETVVERVRREWEARGITVDQYEDVYKAVVANFSTQQVPTSLKQVGYVVSLISFLFALSTFLFVLALPCLSYSSVKVHHI